MRCVDCIGDEEHVMSEDVMYAVKLIGLLAGQLRLSQPEVTGHVTSLSLLLLSASCRTELGLVRYCYWVGNQRGVFGVRLVTGW